MAQPNEYDLIIVGGGAMGLATAYHTRTSGKRVLVLEQYDFFNALSSSGGATRQFRIQYAEEYMARLVLDTIPLWDELQQHSSETLRTKVGSLWFGDPNVESSEGEINAAMEVMTTLGIPFEPLDAAQIEARFGFANLPQDHFGFFQPDGGTINVPATLRTLHAQVSTSQNTTLLANQPILEITPNADGLLVRTETESYQAKKLVITAGPFTNRVLNPLGLNLGIEIWQMVSCYFKKRASDVDYPSWFVFEKPAEDYDPGLYYGFEEVPWSNPGYIRVAPAFARHIIYDPSDITPTPDPIDIELTTQWVQNHMPGLEPTPHDLTWCLAALPIDPYKKMFLDFAPPTIAQNNNIIIFSSGWAFKYVPLIGKICADLALTGTTSYDITPFAIADTPKITKSQPSHVAARRRIPF